MGSLLQYLSLHRNAISVTGLNSAEEQELIDHVKAFGAFQDYDMAVLSDSARVSSGDAAFILAVVSLSKDVKSAKTLQYRYTEVTQELLGFTQLHYNFGRLLIRPETIQDKLVEIFIHAEVDDEKFPVFSKKYYLLTDQPDRRLPASMLSVIEKYDGLHIEIMDHHLLVSKMISFSEGHIDTLLKFLSELGRG